MMDDLRQGHDGQDGFGSEPDEEISSTSAARTVIGQAGETVTVTRPAPGETVEIQAAAGQTYVLSFPPGEAQVQVRGANFILGFDDNGDGTPDSQVVFLDLATVARSDDPPAFQIAGIPIGSETLIDQALALAGQDNVPLDDVAAGPGGLGSGATAYSDDLGSILDLLAAQGVIAPVELQFGLLELEDEPTILLEEEAPPLLINEIGVNVQMLLPGAGDAPNLGEPTVITDGDSSYGGEYGDGFVDNNGSVETAQEIARSDFGVGDDPDVEDDSDPRVRIEGNINENNDVDYYSLQLVAGETLTLDVDFADNFGDDVDIQLFLLDANGNVVASNDDSPLDSGSFGGFDSFLTYSVPTSGTYYIAVTSFNNDISDGGVPSNSGNSSGDYVVQVSIDNYQGDDGESPDFSKPHPFNFVELLNTANSEVTTASLAMEILNHDGTVVSFDVPDGVTIPAGGFVVFYQVAADYGAAGTETIFGRVYDSTGTQVSEFDIPGATFWGLGEDTTAPLAVNLVFQGSQSLDSFAANVLQADLGGLTGASFDGAPAGFGSPLLNLDFETFNGDFTGNHHIFSRVNLTDTGTQSDWTTNNTPTDGALNDVVGGPLGGGGPFNVVYVIDVSGSVDSGPGSVLEDEIQGLLALNQSIIDAGLAGQVEISVIPFSGSAVDTVTFSTANGLSSGSSLGLNGLTLAEYLAAMPHGGGTNFESAMDAARAWFLDGDRYLGEDNFVFFLSDGGASYNPASFPEFYEPSDPDFINATILAYGIGAGANLTNLDLVDDGADNDSAISVLNPDDLAAVLTGSGGGGTVGVGADQNPWDPVNDDLNPGQDNPDPLAGQNFLQAAGGGSLVEGFGGPDFLLGAGGNDSLYGGGQELYAAQTDKTLSLIESLFFAKGGEGGAAALGLGPFFSDHNDFLFGEAGDDEIYGGSGGDYMIGGQGNDSMDGGTGDDQIYGDGSEDIGGLPDDDLDHVGHDVIAGDALNNGGSDGGEGIPIPRLVTLDEESGIAVIGEYGETVFASAVLGGNDTVLAGNGSDLVSGDALADGAEGAQAYAYSDDSIARPEDGFGEADQGFANDILSGGEGNDLIGGDAAAIVLGDGGEGALFGTAAADSMTLAIFGASEGPLGSDTIDGGEGGEAIGGDSLAVTSGVLFGASRATAANVASSGGEYGGEADKASAGGDWIVGDEVVALDPGIGDYGSASAYNDTIGGDATAVASASTSTAWAEVENVASAFDGSEARAGTDVIVGDSFADGGEGAGSETFHGSDDVLGGDAAAASEGAGGTAYAWAGNDADASGGEGFAIATAGDDTLIGDNVSAGGAGQTAFGGNDLIGGDAVAIMRGDGGEGSAYGSAFNIAHTLDGSEGSAGSDQIAGDNAFGPFGGTAHGGSDTIGGDVAAMLLGIEGSAAATATNLAGANGGAARAGDDIIYGDNAGDGGEGFSSGGNDVIAGDAVVLVAGAEGQASANAFNQADGAGASAGDDVIYGQQGDDVIAGDALSIAHVASAVAGTTASNGGSAGNDWIEDASGNATLAGDALAIGTDLFGSALATANNTASDGSEAGDDTLSAGVGQHFIGGDAAVLAEGYANAPLSFQATTHNTASGIGASAGNDVIAVGDAGDDGSIIIIELPEPEPEPEVTIVGALAAAAAAALVFSGSAIAGESLAYGDFVHATATNEVAGDGGEGAVVYAGNDTITAGAGGHVIAGEALALGDGGNATASNQVNSLDLLGIVGSDSIATGAGDDLIAGDALATGGGQSTVNNNDFYGNEPGGLVSQDTIVAGGGDDTLSGDALAVGGHASVDYGGDDSINGGEGNDLIAGDALAIGGGSTSVTVGGDDTLLGGAGNDTIFGDSSDGSEIAGGDDVINGGDGNDSMTGGLGSDTFIFNVDALGDTDTITDFQAGLGGDVLDLSALLSGESASGSVLDDFLRFSSDGVSTTIEIDADGLGGVFSDGTIVLQGIGDLTVGGTVTDQTIIDNLLSGGNLVVDT